MIYGIPLCLVHVLCAANTLKNCTKSANHNLLFSCYKRWSKIIAVWSRLSEKKEKSYLKTGGV